MPLPAGSQNSPSSTAVKPFVLKNSKNSPGKEIAISMATTSLFTISDKRQDSLLSTYLQQTASILRSPSTISSTFNIISTSTQLPSCSKSEPLLSIDSSPTGSKITKSTTQKKESPTSSNSAEKESPC